MTIPKLKLPGRNITRCGKTEDIASLLSELSCRVELDDVLAHHTIPNVALLESIRKWSGQFIIPEIDALIDADISVSPERPNTDYDVFDGQFQEGDWILLFRMESVDYHEFDITEPLKRYEASRPGLGQSLLRAIDRTPYEIATPSYMLNYIRYYCWGGMENEREYATDYIGEDDPEEIESFINGIPAKRSELEEAVPAWALFPKKGYKGEIPPEIQEILRLSQKRPRYKHMVYPYGNMPGILLWEDSANLWERTLMQVEEDAMNAGDDLQIGGRYWPLPLNDPAKLQEVFDEIENYIAGFYQLLQAIRNLKNKERI